MMTEVGLVRSTVVVVSFCEDKDVVAATERVFENSSGTEIDIRIVSGSLVR
jgi:hypothetical protein